MVRRQRVKKNLLSVQELAKIMDDGVEFSKANKTAALEKFTECITRSCQELMTALSISSFATDDGDRAQLLKEADLLIEMSKDCLDHSRFLLQNAYDKAIRESTESAKLADTLSAEFLSESTDAATAASATQQDLPRLILAKGVVLTQDNLAALHSLTPEQTDALNAPVRVHNEKMHSLAKKYRQEVCASVDTKTSIDSIKARFGELRAEAVLMLQKAQQEAIDEATRRFFQPQRHSLSGVSLDQAEEAEAIQRRKEQLTTTQAEQERRRKATARAVERIMDTTEYMEQLQSFKYELMQIKGITTQALTQRLNNAAKAFGSSITAILEGNDPHKSSSSSNNNNSNGQVNVQGGVAMKGVGLDTSFVERECFDIIVTNLYPLIMTVFVQENNDMDMLACVKLDVLGKEMTPRKAGIREIFWLTEDEGRVAEMYKDAIACVKKLPEMDNVTKKFTCLRSAFELIQKSVSEHHRGKSTEKKALLSSDDLISIMSFVVIKSQLADCKAEVEFMSQLIPDVLCIGEEGFMLATFMSCIELLIRISSEDLEDAEPETNPL